MQNATAYILGLAILLFQGRTNSRLIGKWEAVEPKENLTTVLEFGRGGLYSRTIGVTQSGTYRIEGNRIVETDLKGDTPAGKSVEFAIEGNSLVLKTDEGDLRLNRLGPKGHGGPSIIGRWGIHGGFLHGGDKGVIEVAFAKEGQTRFRILREPRGRYRIKRDFLVTTIDGDQETNRFRFEEGLLILKSTGQNRRCREIQASGMVRHLLARIDRLRKVVRVRYRPARTKTR